MTTNAGARDMTKSSMGFSDRFGDLTKGRNKTLERMFSPEFRNRLDAIITFSPLPQDVVLKVVQKFMHELDGQLADKRVTIEVTDAANAWLCEKGYDEHFGARPMERTIQEHIKKPVAGELLFGDLQHGGRLQIDVDPEGEGIALKVLESFEPLPEEQPEDDEVDGDGGTEGPAKEPVPV